MYVMSPDPISQSMNLCSAHKINFVHKDQISKRNLPARVKTIKIGKVLYIYQLSHAQAPLGSFLSSLPELVFDGDIKGFS